MSKLALRGLFMIEHKAFASKQDEELSFVSTYFYNQKSAEN